MPMDGWRDADSHPAVGSDVAAMVAETRRLGGLLADIRRRAQSVASLPWESPAGANFRSYLIERCAELTRTIDLLDSAVRQLGDYEAVVLDAEMLQRQAGP